MKILIVDDMMTRHDAFARKYGDISKFEVHHTTLVMNAIKLLNKEVWDLVYLDHDLADLEPRNIIHEEEYGDRYLSGRDISIAITKMDPNNYPKEVIIHSWNFHGAKRMKEDIESVGIKVSCVPFDPKEMGIAENRESGG